MDKVYFLLLAPFFLLLVCFFFGVFCCFFFGCQLATPPFLLIPFIFDHFPLLLLCALLLSCMLSCIVRIRSVLYKLCSALHLLKGLPPPLLRVQKGLLPPLPPFPGNSSTYALHLACIRYTPMFYSMLIFRQALRFLN